MRKHRHGMMLFDAVMASLLLSMMTVVLVMGVSRQRATSHRLMDARTASQFAERTLLDLQQGAKTPAAPADTRVTVEPVKGFQAAPGYTWTRVTVHCNRESATLLGLAKETPEAKP